MLNPCNPCCCPGAPCEQCMFGYRSKEDNHESMRSLILKTIAGEKPVGWRAASYYMDVHRDWRGEIGEDVCDIGGMKKILESSESVHSKARMAQLEEAIRKIHEMIMEAQQECRHLYIQAKNDGRTIDAFEYAVKEGGLVRANTIIHTVLSETDLNDIV